ncbi:MAG: MerR family transcriptional regulator [Deltaproteobacteria bacterium]|nr:MerR family transcriptional regulator [Deltaproteobacteria bacterium]
MQITEVCKRYSLSADTLRYYERIGLIPSVERTTGGIRNYSEQDCNWIGFIKCMRKAGVQVGALIEYVRLFQLGEAGDPECKDILVRERNRIAQQLAELQSTLELLDYKIEKFETDMRTAENDLKRNL